MSPPIIARLRLPALVLTLLLFPTPAGAQAPSSFATTDGDVLTGAIIDTPAGRALAIGGNFRHVIEPGGRSVAALNFAVVNEATGKVLHAGHANGFVTAMTQRGGVLYIGGRFTSIDGVSRDYLAALDAATSKVLSFNPGSAGVVSALAIQGAGGAVYVGSGSGVRAYTPAGVLLWSVPVSGGPVMTILSSPDRSKIFVGGMFDKVGALAQHGLFQVSTAGVLNRAFAPTLRANTHIGPRGSFDGSEIISLAWEQTNPALGTLMVGGAGGIDNIYGKMRVTDGFWYWRRLSVGDVQGLAVVNGSVFFGYHRNNPNPPGSADKNYVTQIERIHGVPTAWDGLLSGLFYKYPDQAAPDGGNGGVQEIVNDPAVRKVFMLGAFTEYARTCNLFVRPTVCVNNPATKPMQSIAVYTY